MNNNILLLDDITNQNFNFKNFLKNTDSIIWKNCSNLSIYINSKINKLILLKSNNIKLKMSDTISGIEIENCKNINITVKKNKDIKSLDSYKSDIIIKLNNKQKNSLKINNEKSNIIFIQTSE